MNGQVIRGATLAGVGAEYTTLNDGALAWRGERIEWLGPTANLPAEFSNWTRLDAAGALLTPALIDCHTHLVYAGDRSEEFAARLAGESYAEIARRGGGILSTVRATRAASIDALVEAALPRVDALRAEGVATLEIKSGYGLELAAERRILEAARRIGALRPDLKVVTTFLGAHALPPEYAGRADDYVDLLCTQMLPELAAAGLVDAVDAYCEQLAFSPAQVERLFETAVRLGLPVKLHAEQFSNLGGAALAARHGALSADHLEWLDDAGIALMRASGTVAVLLPAAWYFLRETCVPPIAALRAAGVPMAVASDGNPGSAPVQSLLTAMTMACVSFGLSPREALRGATQHAARALGLDRDRGRLEAGLRADFVVWNAKSEAALCARLGGGALRRCWVGGVERRVG